MKARSIAVNLFALAALLVQYSPVQAGHSVTIYHHPPARANRGEAIELQVLGKGPGMSGRLSAVPVDPIPTGATVCVDYLVPDPANAGNTKETGFCDSMQWVAANFYYAEVRIPGQAIRLDPFRYRLAVSAGAGDSLFHHWDHEAWGYAPSEGYYEVDVE